MILYNIIKRARCELPSFLFVMRQSVTCTVPVSLLHVGPRAFSGTPGSLGGPRPKSFHASIRMEPIETIRSKCQVFIGHVGPVLVLLLCFAIFSTYTVLAKIALLGGTNPLVMAFLRELIAISVLFPAMLYSERRKSPEKRRYFPAYEDSGNFMVLGAVMVYGVQLISALVRVISGRH